MKALVLSLDKTNRLNPGTTDCIQAFRPSVVSITQYVKGLLMEKKVDILESDLPDSITDADFLKFYRESKGDRDLAVQSFIAAVKGNPKGDFDNEKAAEISADVISGKSIGKQVK